MLVALPAVVTVAAGPASATGAPRASAEVCAAASGAWEWGFKESFRAYISGSIANGEWTTEGDVGYDTPLFFAEGLASSVMVDGALQGALTVEGALRFTGHDGILDTRIGNPTVRLPGDGTLEIVADIVGTTQSFVEVDAREIVLVEGELASGTWSVEGSDLVLTGVPLELTSAGADSFGTYPAGEAFDPITVRLDFGTPECADAAAATASPDIDVRALVLALISIAVLTAAAVLGTLARRRDRRARAEQAETP
jgi:hypothetical protein